MGLKNGTIKWDYKILLFVRCERRPWYNHESGISKIKKEKLSQ